MTSFQDGAPFVVRGRDVYLLSPALIENYPEPDDLARALLASRLFGRRPNSPLPAHVSAHLLDDFAWDRRLPSLDPPEKCHLWVGLAGERPQAGAPALFAGWTRERELLPDDATAADLRPPESFRMANLNLIPSYSRSYMRVCYLRWEDRRDQRFRRNRYGRR